MTNHKGLFGSTLFLSFLFFGMIAQASSMLHIKGESFDPLTLSHQTIYNHEMASSQVFVVQFQNPVTESDKQRLEQEGYAVVGYIPDNALLVHSPHVRTMNSLSSQLQIRAIVPFFHRWKMSLSLPTAHVFNHHESIEVLVRTVSPTPLESKVPFFEIVESSGEYHIIRIAIADLNKLALSNQVLWVEPRPEIETFVLPLEPDSQVAEGNWQNTTGFETGTKIMSFEEAWSRNLKGQGQSVAMADTGLDKGVIGQLHVDFSTVRRGFHYGLYAKDWSDPMGHGTHVAGSVMSQGAASQGLFKGGAFEAEMIPQGMWSPMLKNLSVPAKLADMFKPAYESGARIHTNSWGSPRDLGKYSSMSIQVDDFMWNNPEMLVIFAAGNSGVDDNKDGRIDAGSVSFPGTAKNTLTVGASENYLLTGGIQRPLGDLMGGKPWSVEPLKSDLLSNNANGLAAFSSRGPTADGRIKPDVVAPGTNIVSNCSTVEGSNPLWGKFNNDYCYSGGTSMSTPLTAGAAAVVRQSLIERWNIANPTAALVKATLMASADDLYPGQYGEVGKARGQELLSSGPNSDQGFGRVNVANATANESVLAVYDETTGVKVGESWRRSITVPEASSLKVTLVYTDAPGVESASKALVNDLDLKVFVGNQVFQSSSRVNNVEWLNLENASGEVTVEILGQNVPMGKNGAQPFAVVISK